MAITLAEIRAKLQQQEDKKQGNFGTSDNAIYPFWNMPEGSKVRSRLLPDADESNPYFWVEKLQIKLPFPGIKNDPNSKPVLIQVPCMEQYGESCPILAQVRPWFKDANLADLGKKYWKKKSYLMQGFVRENPIDKDKENLPENPIRRFIMGSQIFNLVKAALMDPELEHIPTDYEHGLDFIIAKSLKANYADYNTSTWSRKESTLTEAELSAIEQHGLFNLKDFLGKKPDAATLQAMTEMFEASVDGQPYDLERWGQFFKPFGQSDSGFKSGNTGSNTTGTGSSARNSNSNTTDSRSSQDSTSVIQTTSQPTQTAHVSTGNKAEDILAKIRSRKA